MNLAVNVVSAPPDIWSNALCSLNDLQRLVYFSERKGPQFFPVLDKEMTAREVIDELLSFRFSFNHEVHQLGEGMNWLDNPSEDIEWLILLHKFYYAPGLGKAWQESADPRYLARWCELTDRWILQVPAGFIAAEVTGRRVQNWIYAWYYFVYNAETAQIDPAFHERFLASLSEQVNYLCEHLAPARNHRTIALYSIFLASVVFPEMTAASYWRAFSLEQIHANMMQDMLTDGVHCELSTYYHHLVLKNYLAIRKLAKLNNIPIKQAFDQRLNLALDFAMYVHKPDGKVPSFGDGDVRCFSNLLYEGSILYDRTDLLFVATQGKQGRAPAQRCAIFRHGGYSILRSGWGNRQRRYKDEHFLMLDCGPLGAGNHGHLDALSIEVSAYGCSLVVDPGRYTYHEQGDINWRVKFRSTEYHNTVLVDGINQTRYTPGQTRYKISGPAPVTRLHQSISSKYFDYLHGSAQSDEYDALHHRQILQIYGEYWIIVDTLSGVDRHRYEQLFHLSAKANNQTRARHKDGAWHISSPNLCIVGRSDQQLDMQLTQGFVSQSYGEKQAAPVLRFIQEDKVCRFISVLYPFRKTPPEIYLATYSDSAKSELAISVSIQNERGQHISDHCICPNPCLDDIGKLHWLRAFTGGTKIAEYDANGQVS